MPPRKPPQVAPRTTRRVPRRAGRVRQTDALGTIDMDAWGNTLAGTATGAWATDQTGWKHSTKRLDPAAGGSYVFTRWSEIELGSFLSRAPRLPFVEEPYALDRNDPQHFVDPRGQDAYVIEEPTDYGDCIRHRRICFDLGLNNEGMVMCYDLFPGKGYKILWIPRLDGCRIVFEKYKVPWDDKATCEGVCKQKSEIKDDIVQTIGGTPKQDEKGVAWGEERERQQDRSYKFPFKQCHSFVNEGVSEYNKWSPPNPYIAAPMFFHPH